MIQCGSAFSTLWDGYRKVNKGGMISLFINATNNQYLTLTGVDFNSYFVPASYKFVVVGIEMYAVSTTTTYVTFNIGYGDNATSTVAPANVVAVAGYVGANTQGMYNYLSSQFEIPAGKYPFIRSTSTNDRFTGNVIGYLQAV